MTLAHGNDKLAALHDLTGKVALVTGGSRGIGRAIAQGLAEAGADVVVASRKLDSCEVAAAEINESTGRRAIAIAAHVGHWNECDDLMAAALDHFGRLDVLVSNAGMSPVYDSVELHDRRDHPRRRWHHPQGVGVGHAPPTRIAMELALTGGPRVPYRCIVHTVV